MIADILRFDKGIGCVAIGRAEGKIIDGHAEVSEQEGLVEAFSGDVLDRTFDAVDAADFEGGGEVDAFIDAGVQGEDSGGEGGKR